MWKLLLGIAGLLLGAALGTAVAVAWVFLDLNSNPAGHHGGVNHDAGRIAIMSILALGLAIAGVGAGSQLDARRKRYEKFRRQISRAHHEEAS